MKYAVILGDGMADWPIEDLDGKTPLEYASTPMMDKLSKSAEIGMVRTVPKGMSPGSDTANLSVLGYNPREYYSGRSPLEALSIGVDMKDTDVALRCNIVTLSEQEKRYEDRTIIDHSSSEISTEDAAILLDACKKELERDGYKFYTGTSYRHLLIIDNGKVMPLIQPHDVLGQVVGDKLPQDEVLRDMMIRSYDILVNHPINIERKNKGLNPANSLWFWGAGTKPSLTSFEGKTNKSGAMISAVDLLKGIAVGAKMKVILVDGVNGGLNTNYEGKANAAVDTLINQGTDFVYVHVEAPDEMGHQGSVERKIKAIEYLDFRIIKPIYEGLISAGEDIRLLIMPDHPTPVKIRTHTDEPIPYMLYDSTKDLSNDMTLTYNEKNAKTTGIYEDSGYRLIDKLLELRS